MPKIVRATIQRYRGEWHTIIKIEGEKNRHRNTTNLPDTKANETAAYAILLETKKRYEEHPENAPTIGDALEAYLELKQNTNGAHNIHAVINNFKTYGIYGMKLKDVSWAADHYRKERRANGIQDATINREFNVLGPAVFLATGVRPLLKKTPRPAGRNDNYSKEEMRRLLDAAAEVSFRTYLFILLLYSTGQRKGAVKELRWDKVDFIKRQIDFRAPEDGKRRKPRAIIPMGDELYEALLTAKRGRTQDIMVGDYKGRTGTIDQRSGFKAAVRRAGLTEKHIIAHGIRHTFAKHLQQDGRPKTVIQSLLAHQELRTTDIYLDPEVSAQPTDEMREALKSVSLTRPSARKVQG